MFHRLGFGLLVSVPRSLSIQPPFATQALNSVFDFMDINFNFFGSLLFMESNNNNIIVIYEVKVNL